MRDQLDAPQRINAEQQRDGMTWAHRRTCHCSDCVNRVAAAEAIWWGIGALRYRPIDALFDSAPLEG